MQFGEGRVADPFLGDRYEVTHVRFVFELLEPVGQFERTPESKLCWGAQEHDVHRA